MVKKILFGIFAAVIIGLMILIAFVPFPRGNNSPSDAVQVVLTPEETSTSATPSESPTPSESSSPSATPFPAQAPSSHPVVQEVPPAPNTPVEQHPAPGQDSVNQAPQNTDWDDDEADDDIAANWDDDLDDDD